MGAVLREPINCQCDATAWNKDSSDGKYHVLPPHVSPNESNVDESKRHKDRDRWPDKQWPRFQA